HPLLGRRMPPQRELTRPDGTRTRVAELLHAARGVLIATDGADGTGSKAAQLAQDWADRIDIVTGTWSSGTSGPAGPQAQAVLIRPDGYVAWTAPGSDSDLTDALTRWFGAPHPPARPL
ncbi:monooxygenase, partial [Streptomyces sp. SID337]|nr:monooxygenase [Streptomyces sp. SID337]